MGNVWQGSEAKGVLPHTPHTPPPHFVLHLQVLQQEGLVADAESEVAAVALRPEQVSEYVEVHMEQVRVGTH